MYFTVCMQVTGFKDVVILLCVFMQYIFLLKGMLMLEVKEDTVRKIESFNAENVLVMEYYSNLIDNINNLEELRKDYNDELENIYNEMGRPEKFIRLGEETESVYMDSSNMDCNNDSEVNPLIKSIIANTKMKLEKLGVKYKINVDVPNDIKIDYMDLSSVMINMFGNALEALEIYVNDNKKTESKVDVDKYHLKADIISDEKGINIIVENVKSSNQKTRTLDGKYITSKKEKDFHGYGMQIIERIAEKYNGYMKVEYGERIFRNNVKLCNMSIKVGR